MSLEFSFFVMKINFGKIS